MASCAGRRELTRGQSVWLAGDGLFDGSYLGKVLPFLPIAMVQSLVTALGERIGWRGFLAPTLYRTHPSFLNAGARGRALVQEQPI